MEKAWDTLAGLLRQAQSDGYEASMTIGDVTLKIDLYFGVPCYYIMGTACTPFDMAQLIHEQGKQSA